MSHPIVPILGAGESGTGAALLAVRQGLQPWVSDAGAVHADRATELDGAGVEWEADGHDETRLLAAAAAGATVIKSPGIPDSAPLLQQVKASGGVLISEIEFASRFARTDGQHVIAVTGSNGKTTTTALIAALFKGAGCDVACVGNIGKSWARDLSERHHPAAVQVVEVSSFQLDGITSFRPDVAILLNITPDHLDRYNNDIEQYADSKWRIASNQNASDILVLNADDPLSVARWKRAHAMGQITARVVAVSSGQTESQLQNNLAENGLNPWGLASVDHPDHPYEFTINLPHQNPFTMTIQELALQGKHNLYNSMAASVAARALDLRKEGIRDSLAQFDAIEHRMEFVVETNGITFVNDSKATNVNSTWYALESTEGPIIWIAGGVDKGNDYTSLLHLVTGKVDYLICLGKNNKKLIDAFGERVDSCHEVSTASEAVQLAYQLGSPGHTALLSPACASFDLFGSYEERGREFKAAVRNL
ncbi:MAG: UDP-N-acetylmuramoyl-L-alanine--D-glutamate ligase [Flavobacteriales bacterium]|nr:UDP-N-acetylmuramoyl-L-alanine--D-glutamate ligase [Flavobacteriales bacterium]